METITYLNIKVEGTPITKITRINIENAVGTYGTAKVTGEVDYNAGMDYVQRSQPGTAITISTSAAGQPGILFMGVLSKAGIKKTDQYALLDLEMKSTACNLDKKKENQSFQNTGSTYEEVMNKALAGEATLNLLVPDKATGTLIMRYQETSWAFVKRMASALGAPVSTDTVSKTPILTIGIPNTGKSYTLSDVEYDSALEDGGTASTQIKTAQAVALGDSIQYGSESSIVTKYKADIQDGVLKTTVSLTSQYDAEGYGADTSGTGATAGTGTSLDAGSGNSSQIMNTQASGKMFKGIVQAVQMDKVQVHLVDIDSSYDGGGDFWFPYSTAYSSSDGSGFYCMPAVGDTVRVFFPSDNEADAFAASSVNVSPLDNPLHKKWRSPAGKEILLTEEGMFITCKESKIFINLEDEKGITIYSDKDINVNSMSNMTLYAKENITLQAENKILLSTGESYIDITDKLIQMGAEQIMIN